VNDPPNQAPGTGRAGQAGPPPPRLRSSAPPSRRGVVAGGVALVRENKGARVGSLERAMLDAPAPHLPGRVITGVDEYGRYLPARPLGIFHGPGHAGRRARPSGRMLWALWFVVTVVTLVAVASR
jgi:hypothetical protein